MLSILMVNTSIEQIEQVYDWTSVCGRPHCGQAMALEKEHSLEEKLII